MSKWTVILLFALLCGCESPVELNTPEDYQAKLVVESHFSPDSLWWLRVRKSASIMDTISTSSELITPDVTVIISGENNFSDTLQYDTRGIFRSVHVHRPVSGMIYTTQVSATGYPQVEASSEAPILKSNLLTVSKIDVDDSLGTETYSLRFQVEDMPGSNYYQASISQAVPFCDSDTAGIVIHDAPDALLYYDRLTFESNSPLFRDFIETLDDPTLPAIDENFWRPYFSDKLFESTIQQFEITFESKLLKSIQSRFILEIWALSDELFAYERSLAIHDINFGLPNIARSTPISLYSNVQNGLGIFAGFTRDIHRFDSQQNEWQEDVLEFNIEEIQPCH
ncbi:MAG: DUF4249 family protein [Bacteroidetes bacterium]|nr:DUF4249 family protein [Bacteroidota bacterium]